MLLLKILGWRNAECVLECPGEVRSIVVGTHQSDFRDVEFWIVVEQMTCSTHADCQDKALGSLTGDGGDALTELEEAEVHFLCYVLGI